MDGQEYLETVIGKEVNYVKLQVLVSGRSFMIVTLDGENQICECNIDRNRLSVDVVDGKITKAWWG